MPPFSNERINRRIALMLLLAMTSGAMTVALPPAPLLADDGGDGGSGGGNGGDGGAGGDGSDDGGGDGDNGGNGDGEGHDDSGENEEESDHEYAWRARQRGELRSLEDVLERVREQYDGRVLEVKLEREKNQAWYEIRILDKLDRVLEVRVPALRKVQNFHAGKR